MRVFLIVITCAICLGSTKAQTGTVNLSHDLVRLGIAGQNLAPDMPSLDARPLFQAALEYVKNHNIHLVTLDPGAYYFLTPQNPITYLRFSSLTNLTVDLAGSTIYFGGAFLQGFALTDCQHVMLTNFKIDFLQPPYTYVQLASVDPNHRTLTYKTLPRWPDPATLTIPAGVSVVLWAVVFRHEKIVPGTSRMQVAQPIANNLLSLVQDNTPWTQSATLATLKPGDIIVVTQRGGSPPIIVTRGDSITISKGSFYGSGGIAVLLNSVVNSVVDHVRVMPREGNLIASNADGIHFIDSGPNNHIRNCYVTGTLDDALAIDSHDIATVLTATQYGNTSIRVNRTAYEHFPNGTAIHFVDPYSAHELPGATIVSQDPPDSDPPVFDGIVNLTFNQPLPVLAAGVEWSLQTRISAARDQVSKTTALKKYPLVVASGLAVQRESPSATITSVQQVMEVSLSTRISNPTLFRRRTISSFEITSWRVAWDQWPPVPVHKPPWAASWSIP
jgi:hypothetical protein